jgi:hypothetical protein
VRAFGSIDFQSEMTKNRIVAASGAVILVVLIGKKSDLHGSFNEVEGPDHGLVSLVVGTKLELLHKAGITRR